MRTAGLKALRLLNDQKSTERIHRHQHRPLSPSLSLSFSLSVAHSPLEEATLISQALMRQNGTDLVRRCATGGAGQGGWCSRGERGERGGRLVYAICHPAPAWHGSPWSGGVGGW